MSYKPPIMADIEYKQREIAKEIINEQEHYIYKQFMKVSNIIVDEERLKKALAFDRGQFFEGYHQGYEARDNEIIRCKDCFYYDEVTIKGEPTGYGYCSKSGAMSSNKLTATDYCSYAEQKEEENG